MWTKRAVAVVSFVVFPFVVTGAGCSENPTATAKCSSEKDGDKCQACCTTNGASGYKYVTGGTCGCLGGK